jgi:hypothetical protein
MPPVAFDAMGTLLDLTPFERRIGGKRVDRSEREWPFPGPWSGPQAATLPEAAEEADRTGAHGDRS